jgi:hypothetical protein
MHTFQEHLTKKSSSFAGESSQFTSLKKADSRVSQSGNNNNTATDVDLTAGKLGGGDDQSLMWVDKYKPASLKQIIGKTLY